MMRILTFLFTLSIVSCSTQKAIVSDDYKISMAKGACFGSCPVYTIEIDRAGKAMFNGERFTDKFGEHSLQLDDGTFNKISSAFENANLSAYKDEYKSQIPDMPTVTISYTNNGVAKSVKGKGERPEKILELQKMLEEVVRMEDWTSLDTSSVTEEIVEEEEKKAPIIENEFIIKFKNGTWLSRWVREYSEYGLRVSEPMSDDQMTWLVRYKKSSMDPQEFLAMLQSDDSIESAEFNTRKSTE